MNADLPRRAIGWCTNLECSEHCKPMFLLAQPTGSAYWCPTCRHPGDREDEQYVGLGESWYSSVAVEFDFDPIERRYRGMARVFMSESLEGASLLLRSPLVKTDRRATDIAQALLANLNTHGHARTTTYNLYLDDTREEVSRQCAALGEIIEKATTRAPGVFA